MTEHTGAGNDSMSNSQKHKQGLLSFIPSRGRGLIGLIAALVLVFLLGLMMSGGSDSEPSGTTEVASASADAPADTMWTCSMHPQIKLHKPGNCPICFMDLIPLLPSSGSGLAPNQLQLSENARKLAQIETTPVRRAFAETKVRMVGKLAYDETRLADITAWVPGRLDRLYADYTGIRVNKGDPMVSLYSPQLVSAQEELRQAKAAVSSLQGGSDVLQSTAQATIDAAREKLRLYGLTAEQIAEIENADTTRTHLTIYAPVGGIVVMKQATEGMYVQTGSRIYSIADLSKLWVVFDAYESDLPWLRDGQQVAFTSPSFPGEKFTAQITFIEPTIDDRSRTARVRAAVDNKNGRLKPDMFVSGEVYSRLDGDSRIIGRSAAKASDDTAPLIIPATAPLITGTRAIVYVRVSNGDDGPVYEGRQIELGPKAGDFYIVKSGLSEGEEVVTNGAFKIDSELQIQAKPSMMAPPENQPAPVAAAHEPTTMSMSMEPTEISDEARAALSPVYNSYFAVQMALAKDQADSIKDDYNSLIDAVDRVDMELFHGQDHTNWMKLAARVKESSRKGADADMDAARGAFEEVSKAMIDLHKAFGHADDVTYYLTYCPMAFNNKGAYWLQTEKIIWNSYFGSKMLRCGEFKDTLYAAGKEGK